MEDTERQVGTGLPWMRLNFPQLAGRRMDQDGRGRVGTMS